MRELGRIIKGLIYRSWAWRCFDRRLLRLYGYGADHRPGHRGTLQLVCPSWASSWGRSWCWWSRLSILGQQIEDATSGRIPIKLIRITLVHRRGLAIAGSMLRIIIR